MSNGPTLSCKTRGAAQVVKNTTAASGRKQAFAMTALH